MQQERERSWKLTEARALEIYNLIQESLDPENWKVLIPSKNLQMPIADFKKGAVERLNPNSERFSPSIVARDCLVILDGLDLTFNTIKTRLDDSFRSILVVNESMNEYVDKMEAEVDEANGQVEEIKDENVKLLAEIDNLKEDLKKKQQGIQPLIHTLKFGVAEIIKIYGEFKGVIGDEKEMKKYAPLVERYVDNIVKLIELRQKQILESPFEYSEMSNIYEEPSIPTPAVEVIQEEPMPSPQPKHRQTINIKEKRDREKEEKEQKREARQKDRSMNDVPDLEETDNVE